MFIWGNKFVSRAFSLYMNNRILQRQTFPVHRMHITRGILAPVMHYALWNLALFILVISPFVSVYAQQPGAHELASNVVIKSVDEAEALLQALNQKLQATPKDISLLVQRGNIYFQMHQFEMAVEDFSKAITLDGNFDAAYFGRGLALGRLGRINDGIDDLSLYIKRHPQSSLAYTKRGVRYLWLGDDAKAKQDLNKAIELNPKNAEAHDDLGVVYARQQNYPVALQHFNQTVTIDPTYQKGFHNLAMVYFLIEQDQLALQTVNQALSLAPNARETLLLKSEILRVMGRLSEAAKIKEDAEFLPQGNWSENISVE